MRRTRIAATVLLVRLLLAVTLLPLIAIAAESEGPSFEGTYLGMGEGVGTDGGGGSSEVVVWVEDLGDSARFTIMVVQFGIVVTAEGPIEAEQGAVDASFNVPITVDSAGVTGDATMTLMRAGDRWALAGTGAGTAMGYEGSGSLTADQVVVGFENPPIGDQIGDMIGSIIGGPSAAEKTAAETVAAVKAGPKASAGSSGSSQGSTSGGTASDQGAAPGTTGGDTGSGTTGESGSDGAAPPAGGEAPTPGSAEATSTAAAIPVRTAPAPTPLSPAAPEPPMPETGKFAAAILAAVVLILQIILA